MSGYEVDIVLMRGPTRFRALGLAAPVVLPADGILVLDHGSASMVVLRSGTLRGIRVLQPGDPAPPMSSAWNDDDAVMLILAAEDGGSVAVQPEDLSVVEPTERISTSSGLVGWFDNRHVQIFSQFDVGVAARRWRVNLW